jgi:2-polyprenyl-6-methoxyphenol hydroxylase-like FAD-dependent oxidoreductase
MRPLDVAIVGAGPAGLSSALFLARAGHRVTIFERFETAKPVGSGLVLQATGLAVLGQLGLREEIERRGARIERLLGRAQPSGRLVLDVRYAAAKGDLYGLAVHRAALFGVLREAVERECLPIETGFDAARAAREGQRLNLEAADGRRRGPFDLIVNAGGARSPLRCETARPARREELPFGALWATLPWRGEGFDPTALEQRYERARKMVGVLPIGSIEPGGPATCAYFWSLKRDELESWRAGGLQRWKDEALRLWPETEGLLQSIVDPEQLTFAAYGHSTMRAPFGEGIVHIGDAFHSTSPQLGQGANMALLDARALDLAMSRREKLEEALLEYARLRRRHVALYQFASRFFTPFYQDDGVALSLARDHLVAPLSRAPFVANLLARIVAGVIVSPLTGEG